MLSSARADAVTSKNAAQWYHVRNAKFSYGTGTSQHILMPCLNNMFRATVVKYVPVTTVSFDLTDLWYVLRYITAPNGTQGS